MSKEEQDHQHMEAKREVQSLERELVAINYKLNNLLPKAQAALGGIQFSNPLDRLKKWSEFDHEEMDKLINDGAAVQTRLDRVRELLKGFDV